MPPAFSALKIKGKRAYDLARNGEKVELQTREIQVLQIEVVAYEYPVLTIEIECSMAHRPSLGRDIGEALQTGAEMTDLQRTSIGAFKI